MAKRKADELEDFTSKHGDTLGMQYSKGDVEEGSALLKDVLVKWKDQVEGSSMSKEEMIAKMKELVAAGREPVGQPVLPIGQGFVRRLSDAGCFFAGVLEGTTGAG